VHTKFWSEKTERKRTHGKPKRKCEDNIRLYLKERRLEKVKWIHLAQDRGQWLILVNTVINLRVP
jgi:hypothetical protein